MGLLISYIHDVNFVYDVYALVISKYNNNIACLQNCKKRGCKAENQVSF